MPTYLCPVCGYNGLELPPADWSICPCCLTEFGYSDYQRGYDVLRAAWIAGGAVWGDPSTPKPPGWSEEAQLHNIGIHLTPNDKAAIKRARTNTIVATTRPK